VWQAFVVLVWFHITFTTFRARITTIHLYLSKLYLKHYWFHFFSRHGVDLEFLAIVWVSWYFLARFSLMWDFGNTVSFCRRIHFDSIIIELSWGGAAEFLMARNDVSASIKALKVPTALYFMTGRKFSDMKYRAVAVCKSSSVGCLSLHVTSLIRLSQKRAKCLAIQSDNCHRFLKSSCLFNWITESLSCYCSW